MLIRVIGAAGFIGMHISQLLLTPRPRRRS
jgi:nucleoside-diphosphate-sugar epimerase